MLLVPVEIKRYNLIGKCAKRIMIKSKFDIKVNKVGLKYHFISNASKLMVQTFWKYLFQFNKNWHRFNSLFNFTAFRHVLHCDTSFPLNIYKEITFNLAITILLPHIVYFIIAHTYIHAMTVHMHWMSCLSFDAHIHSDVNNDVYIFNSVNYDDNLHVWYKRYIDLHVEILSRLNWS